MKRILNKKILSLLLVFQMIFSMPMQAFATTSYSESQNELLLKEELRKAADETQYPNGTFEFLTPNMSTSEDLSSVEFAIVRKGGTAGEASITFKAVDITAKYGEDYTISVQKGLFPITLPDNLDSKPLIESFEGIENASVTTSSSIINERSQPTTGSGIQYEELPTPELKAGGSALRAARDEFTGTTSQRTANWREVNEQEKKAVLTAQTELYEKLPGVTYRFEFAEGEYIKKLRFNNIDDAISEDEEQILLLLLDIRGGVLGENSAGYMNIIDNEAKEPIAFELMKEQISVLRPADSVDVTIRRTSGMYRYGKVTIGTASLSAEANTDYEPILDELLFVPGQETKTVRIPLMVEEAGEEKQFLVKLDSTSDDFIANDNTQTLVTIEASQSPKLMSFAVPYMLEESESLEASPKREVITLNGKTYIVETLSSEDLNYSEYMTVGEDGLMSVSGDHSLWDIESSNRWNEMNVDYTNYMSFNADLANVDYVKVKWKIESSKIDKFKFDYDIKRGRAVIGSGDYHPNQWLHDIYDKDKQNAGYEIQTKIEDPFTEPLTEETMCSISDADRTKNKLYLAAEPYNQYSSRNMTATLGLEWVKLYTKAVTIVTKDLKEMNDPDTGITTQNWIAHNKSEAGEYIHIGGLSFGESIGQSSREYGAKETVSFVPKFADNLSQDIRQKVYLWGYKIERKGSNGFYRIKGETLNIGDLLNKNLKDDDGNTVDPSEVLMKGDQIGIAPIYKARNAYVFLEYDTSKGETIGNTFPNDTIMNIGMLDTVDFRLVGKGGNAVADLSAFQSNGALTINTKVWYRTVGLIKKRYEERTFLFSGVDVTTYGQERFQQYWMQKDSSEFMKAGKEFLQNEKNIQQYFQPAENIGLNPAIPGELIFTPQKTFTKLTMLFGNRTLKAKVNPKSSDQDMGAVAYIPKEGVDLVPGNKDKPIILSPVYINKVHSFTGIPDEGYRIVWDDYTGDLNEDGNISREEKNNIRKYEDSLNRIPVVGNTFNYIPKFDHSLIYYLFEPKSENTRPGEVHGTVTLRTRNILDPDSKYIEKQLSDVVVNVNGHNIKTDKDGHFSMEHTDFEPSKLYNYLLTYNNVSYSGYIKSNYEADLIIEEYDTFTPHSFKVDGNSNVSRIDNSNKDYTFTFLVNSNVQGLSPAKAWIGIYSKEGILRDEMPIEVNPENGVFSFTLNPNKKGILPGDYMTIQIEDQNGRTYLNHNVGLDITRYLDTFSLLNSFKIPGKPFIDFVGNVDAAFDLGLAGKLDSYKKETEDGFLIAFGFSEKWEKSLEDGGKVEGEKSTASDEIKETAKDGNKDKIDTTNGKAIDKDGAKKNASKVTSDLEFGISTAFYLRMRFEEDKTSTNYGDCYFEEMFMTATLDGSYRKSAERPTPIGITLFVELQLKGKITGTMVIEQYQGKKRYFNEEGEIDFTKADDYDLNRDFTIYGSLFVQPSIVISAGAKIAGSSVTISGHADFDFRFYTSGKGTGDVKLTADLILKILFYEYTWEVAEKSFSLYSYGRAGISDMLEDPEFLYQDAQNYSISSRDYLENRGLWQSSGSMLFGGGLTTPPFNEQILSQGAYPYPYTLLSTIGDDSQLLLFLDDSGIEEYRNSIQLYYSIYNDGAWSVPQKVDNDDTPDGLPWLCDLGDKVVVAWSSAATELGVDDSVLDTLNNQDIKTRFFDKNTKTFDQVQNVTYNTGEDYFADTEPYIVYKADADAEKQELMIVYKKTDYKSTGVNEALGDILNPYTSLAYRFYNFDNKYWDELTPTEGFYGQGFIDLSSYAKAEGGFIDTDTGSWKSEPDAVDVSLVDLPNKDPFVADYNAVGYKNYGVMAYAIDMNYDTTTTTKEDLFLQLYNFDEGIFYPAIRITDSDSSLNNLVFSEFNDTLYLFYEEDGKIQSLDVGYLIREALLEYMVQIEVEVGGVKDVKEVPVLIWNKANGAYRGPETCVQPEQGADEFMVKADNDNLYVLWGQSDITHPDGIDPNSQEAALPENQMKEHHIYAARLALGNSVTERLYEEDGVTPLKYPEKDETGKSIDYDKVKDINGRSGDVKANDDIIKTYRPAKWSNPIQVTEGTGANYNDLDFEILATGSLRVVCVKGPSTFKQVADKDSGLLGQIVMEDVNARMLMTADYDVSKVRADLKVSPIEMPQAKEMVPMNISIENQALSVLDSLVLKIYEVTSSGEENIAGFELSLGGGEQRSFSYLWEAPENLSGISLRSELISGDTVLDIEEQVVPVSSVINIKDARTELVDRNSVRIFGKAVNEGNLTAIDTEIKIEYKGELISSLIIDRVDIGQEEPFAIEFELTEDMKERFESFTDKDGSVTEKLALSVNAASGTGAIVYCERSASAGALEVMNNILDFSLMSNGNNMPSSISLQVGEKIKVEPKISYMDKSLEQARLVYLASDDTVAEIYDGELIGLKKGEATISVYALPPVNGVIMKASGFRPTNDFATLAEDAVRQYSFTVQVGVDNSSGTSKNQPNTSQDAVATGEITIKTKLDNGGNAAATVSGEQIASLLEKQQDKEVKFTIKAEAPEDANSVDIVLLPEALAEMKKGQVNQLTVVTPLGIVAFDQKTLPNLFAETGEDLTLSISKVDTSTIAEDIQQRVGNRLIYDFTVTRGGKTISQFGGVVTVALPYIPAVGEDINAIIVYYINDKGELEIVTNGHYNVETGTVVFTTDHFSTYAVGYNKVSFNDVAANAWYNHAISFIAARGITSGTGNCNFSPTITLTRSQFVVMLMRAYNIAPDKEPTNNFADAGDTYYTGYLAVAKQLGISEGIGNNLFAPDREITRQEMFTLLYNTLQSINQSPKGDSGKKAMEFTDFEQIDSWAKEALIVMVETGIVSGSNGELHPKNTTTRAEMAQVLYNLLGSKLTGQ